MKTTIYSQHFDHAEWLSKLNFYKDELQVLNGRLAEITKKNNHKDFLREVEHFQNQFMIQEKNIQDLSHAVKASEKMVKAEIAAHPVASDHRKKEDTSKEKEMVESFEKNFNGLRSEFKDFAAKWM